MSFLSWISARSRATPLLLVLLGLGCSSRTEPPASPAEKPGPQLRPPMGPPSSSPEPPKTLLIPPENPALQGIDTSDPDQAFVPQPAFYGEHSWDDVRMRVLGHVAVAGRDLARARAMRSDWEGCAQAYDALIRRMESIKSASETGAPIRESLVEAARRDALLCRALAEGQPLPVPQSPFAAFRAETLQALRTASTEPVPQLLREHLVALAGPLLQVDTKLDTGQFSDFEKRHELRVRLVAAYADQVDPLYPSDPWGIREPSEGPRQARALLAALDAVSDQGELPLATRPARSLSVAGFTFFDVDELATLPTGDSWIDVAGFPGPKSIGRLEVLNTSDTAWVGFLDEQARRMSALEPEKVPGAVEEMIQSLRARYKHGSTYYNIKQIRNTAIRVLARQGHYKPALEVLRAQRPLRHHDWACPNREAILLGIEGRLMLLSGEDQAEETLRRALDASDAFLERVARAEAGRSTPAPEEPAGPR